VLILGLAAAAWYFWARPATAQTGALAASGTIEAVTVNVSPEVGGRVVSVTAQEGQTVTAGQVLVAFDPAQLLAQQTQLQAALEAARAAQGAAEAARTAAEANVALLEAGPSEEQLAVAQTVVDRAEAALEAAQEAYEALPEAARETLDGIALAGQVEQAKAALANAEAQYDLTAAGARPEQIAAAQAQAEAARWQAAAAGAQAAGAEAALAVLDVQLSKLTLAAPSDGVVLTRAIEPGEVASPGAVLLVLGQLEALTITVYVPEDRYGTIQLGQTAEVTVDSYPGQNFAATVTLIADRAEFTPRNVQTAEGRKTTVFAVKLTIGDAEGRLKPGMPADVSFGE
jgi:multidrug resistance efflux pump